MKRREMGDAMYYCERCGVSFLWTAEEQHQAAESGNSKPDSAKSNNAKPNNAKPNSAKPDYCPGCRRLLAAPGRERGLVKWYNHRKKYGFVIRTSGPEIFTHRSGFDGMGRVRPGDLVEFAVEEGEKGPMAVDVRLLARAEKSAKE